MTYPPLTKRLRRVFYCIYRKKHFERKLITAALKQRDKALRREASSDRLQAAGISGIMF